MRQQPSSKPVHDVLCQYLRNRSDLGVRKAVLNGVLESRNPFEQGATRPPRRWFVLFSLLVTVLLGCLVYFGNLR